MGCGKYPIISNIECELVPAELLKTFGFKHLRPGRALIREEELDNEFGRVVCHGSTNKRRIGLLVLFWFAWGSAFYRGVFLHVLATLSRNYGRNKK